jgi:hypothetical protein
MFAMKTIAFGSLVCVACVVGCGGKATSDAPTEAAPAADGRSAGPLAGSLAGGAAFEPRDVTVVTGPAVDSTGAPTGELVLRVVASSAAGVCGRVKDGTIEAGATETVVAVTVRVASAGTSAVAVQAGTYDVQPQGAAVVGAAATAGILICPTGDSASNPRGKSGLVTLTTITGTTVSGSMDVTFDDGTSLKGTFTAPRCASTPTVSLAGICASP